MRSADHLCSPAFNFRTALSYGKIAVIIIVVVVVVVVNNMTTGEMPRAIVVSALLLLFSVAIDSTTKRWTPNVDFEDPLNWDAGHVPSSVDVTVFQEDTVVPVVLPSAGVDVCELVLPADGQLVLEPNANVIISSSSEDTGGCTGRTVKFKRNTPMEWSDPDNWSGENITHATPHVERIPCVYDTVVFNPSNSFSVIVPNVPILIGAMKFGNQTFGQNELNEFVLTDVGDQELKSSSPDNDVSITLTSTLCDDSTGCECGTRQLLNDVCKMASKRCDNKLGCVRPVKPVGHCCWICGAYFLINYDPRFFNILKFNEAMEKDISKIRSSFNENQFFIHTSKLRNGMIHVVLASGTKYVDEINEIAKTIHSTLTSYTKRDIGITNVEMFNSGLSYDVDGMTYGQIALTTGTVIISCLLAIIFYYTNDWKSLLFGSRPSEGVAFVKFQNDTNDVVLIDRDVRSQRKSSFDNPTYEAVENMTQSQTFSEVLSYHSDPSVSTKSNDATDIELK